MGFGSSDRSFDGGADLSSPLIGRKSSRSGLSLTHSMEVQTQQAQQSRKTRKFDDEEIDDVVGYEENNALCAMSTSGAEHTAKSHKEKKRQRGKEAADRKKQRKSKLTNPGETMFSGK